MAFISEMMLKYLLSLRENVNIVDENQGSTCEHKKIYHYFFLGQTYNQLLSFVIVHIDLISYSNQTWITGLNLFSEIEASLSFGIQFYVNLYN